MPSADAALLEQQAMSLAPLPLEPVQADTPIETTPIEVIPLEGGNQDIADFAAPVVRAPSGFTTPVGAAIPSMRGMPTRFQLGVASSLVYDSNFTQAPDTAALPAEDEVTWSISPYVAYQSRGAEWSVAANLALNYNAYFENSDFNGLGYSGSLEIGYRGGPLTVTGTFSSSYDQGVNRYYSNSFVETLNFSTGLFASYQWSPKTSFDARFAYSWSEPDGGTFGGSESVDFDVTAMWQATPLLRIGPGIAWSLESGDTQTDRQTIGPILRAQYKLGNRISLDGMVGLDFVDYSGGGSSDTDFTCSLGVAYRWSELWGMNLMIYHGTVADGSALGTATGSYRETTSISLGYNRRIRRAMWNVDLSYSMDESTSPNSLITPGSTDYFSFRTSLAMPVYTERTTASIFYSWHEESGNPLRDWSGHQIGFQITTTF